MSKIVRLFSVDTQQALEIGNYYQTPWASTQLPRIQLQAKQYSTSINGTRIQTGGFYEPSCTWELIYRCRSDDLAIMQRFYSAWLATDTYLTLSDLVQPVQEPQQTRPLAASSTLIQLTNQVEYHARFRVGFTAAPAYQSSGQWTLCNVQLIESERWSI